MYKLMEMHQLPLKMKLKYKGNFYGRTNYWNVKCNNFFFID